MRKLLTAALIVAATFSFALAQQQTAPKTLEDITRLAHAPSMTDGIGRAVIVVSDKDGNPISNAYAKMESIWGGDNFCESWGTTGSLGALALNPIHMGKLKLTIKAKGYETQKITVDASSLSEPVRVTLVRK